MDVGVWLRSLGLGRYEVAFSDNSIDADVLPDLTDGDLAQLGVNLGDRKRLLKAIARLGATYPATKPTGSAPLSSSADDAERRPITVMFCDLVGSTSLAARLDAEDWRNLVNEYLDEASAAVTNLGGHVLKKLGDGLMALFGYPQAQENDAERAVRAGLGIQRALADLNARNAKTGAPELSARIGLDTGSVVVDAAGEVFGDAPNVAARVQAAAEPGSVLVTGSVQRQVAGLFVVEEKGAHELKGVAQPLSLYRVVRASGGGRRGGARALTPLVGRVEDLDHLTRRWERTRKGEGQLALVIGEAGIGKSRLIEEFHARLAETPHTWVEWSASQLLQNTPLHPIAEWGRLRFRADAPAEERLADLEGTLHLIGLDPAEYAPLLAPLVDIPLAPGRAASFPPEELRRRQLAAMTAWVLAGARSQPVVLAFEDLHWADPTSLDLLRALADRGAQVPMLLLATTRPEFRPDWSVRSHHSLISLSPLDRAQVAHMVSEISARHALSKEVIEGVNERTGGVPLFVEEVTRLLVERGEQGGVQAIPPTLQQSLAARLDRLGAAREVAQVGAVLGRDFVYALLRDVAESDEAALQASLDRLADADLLFVEGAPPEANYRFKHALIQDAAYDSLLKSRRQVLHRRAAEILRDQPERLAAEPEAIAHHFTEAGLDDLAIEWWGKAGDQALRRSAFQEAIAHLGKAIAMADKGSEAQRAQGVSPAPNQRVTPLHVAYGNALFAARGYGAPETTQAFALARESASGDKDAPERLAADWGLWAGSFVRGDLPSMQVHAAAFLSDLEARPDSPEAGIAHRAAGLTRWFAGEYVEARDHLERALALLRPGRDDDLAFRFGLDPGVAAMASLAVALWPLGEIDRAISLVHGAQERSASITHIGTQAYAKMYAAMFHLMRDDHEGVAQNGLELARLALQSDLTLSRAFGVFLQGWAASQSGAVADGIRDMRRSVEDLHQQKVRHFDGLLKIALAEAETRAGDPDRALAVLDEALATSDRTGYRAFEAELHRARGDTLLKREPANPALAEDAFLTAIAIAKQQRTRSFELRAALSLARLYQSTGRPLEAHDVLTPVFEGFTPTPELTEIAEAQVLLALADTDEVTAAVTQRRRRLGLQTSYSQAVLWSKGWAASETKTAFERISDLALRAERPGERFPALYGRILWSVLRGDVRAGRETAEEFLREAEAEGRPADTGVAHRVLGLACTFQGDLAEARRHLELALEGYVRERDGEVREKFGQDTGVAARIFLAHVLWLSADLQRSRQLIEEATRLGNELGHLPSTLNTLGYKTFIESIRNDPESVAADAEALFRVSREHGAGVYVAFSGVLLSWAQGRLNNARRGADDLRKSLAELAGQGTRAFTPAFQGFLAELETAAGETERALAAIDEGFTTARDGGQHFADAFLHRLRGDILLKRSPADPAAAEEAYRTAIAIAKEQGARSYELLASLALAKLYQSTARPADAHTVLAPALEGFSPTPEMPEIAEAQALLLALAERDEVRAAIAQRKRRLHLQTTLAHAEMWSKGFAADETKAAFGRAAELATNESSFSERFAAAHGQWTTAIARDELSMARALASAMLREAEDTDQRIEASVARRGLALIYYFSGAFLEARSQCERALADCDPERDQEVRERFGDDIGTVVMSIFAVTAWTLGEVDRARELIDGATRRAAKLGHRVSEAHPLSCRSILELLRGDATAALNAAEGLEALSREQGMAFWLAGGEMVSGWARGRLGDPVLGAAQLQRALTSYADQGARMSARFYQGLLAEIEAETLGVESALSRIEEALTDADQVEYRWDLAFIHRVHGNLLLKRNPDDPAAAEVAFQTAIAVAKEQGARSYELLASLSLAKLQKSTGRPVEAHAVLAAALEGFSPTPEMLEIAEAEALLAALAETKEVKAAIAQQQRRGQLQVAYGNALTAARGFTAPETTEAFARARMLSTSEKDGLDRLAADFGLWLSSYPRGDLPSMRKHAADCLADVATRPDSPEAGAAHRALGITHYFAGEYAEARSHLERALSLFEPGRDDDVAFRFGMDAGVAAMVYLAFVLWSVGEIGRALPLVERMRERISGLTHANTLALGAMHASMFELMRGERSRVPTNALELVRIVREYDLPGFRAFGKFLEGWMTADGGALTDGLESMRRGTESLRERNALTFDGLIKIALSEAEARTGDLERAAATLDEALATAERTGYRAFEAELRRAHAEMLLKRGPSNPAAVEEAYQAAVAIARKQGTRSFELRAALALAKLYQSTGRPAEAQAVLAPAVEGFSPTPEMPEIAEAQTLLVAIEVGAHVRHE